MFGSTNSNMEYALPTELNPVPVQNKVPQPVCEFHGNLREVINAIGNPELDANTLLATPTMVRETLCPLTADNADFQVSFNIWKQNAGADICNGKELKEQYKEFINFRKVAYDAFNYRYIGKLYDNGSIQEKASSLCNEYITAVAIRATDLGLLTIADLPTFHVCIMNLYDQASYNAPSSSDKKAKATINGIKFALIAGHFFLVQYQSPYSGGQQFMAPQEIFGANEAKTKVPYIQFKDLIGNLSRDCEVYTLATQLCKVDQSAHTIGELGCATFCQNRDGNYSFCAKEEYSVIKPFLKATAKDSWGVRNLIANAEFRMAVEADGQTYATKSYDWMTRELPAEKWAKILACNKVNESIPSAPINTSRKFVPVD